MLRAALISLVTVGLCACRRQNNEIPPSSHASSVVDSRQLVVGHAEALRERRPRPQAVALGSRAVKDGLRTCSRETPKGITGYWAVDAGTLVEADEAVVRFLEIPAQARCLERPVSTYTIQYLGIARGDARLVYANAFFNSGSSSIATDNLVVGCDGESRFWGAVYDPASKQVTDFETNHSYAGRRKCP